MTILRTLLGVIGGGLLLSETALAAGTTALGVPEAREVPVQVTASGPVLLFSDSPELVHGTGVLYRDTVTGPARIFVHHLNGTKRNLKLAVVVRPAGVDAATLVIKRSGISEPSANYAKAAKDSQKKYFTRQTPETIPLNHYQFRELLTGSSEFEAGLILRPEQLATGMVYFEARGPVTVSVLMCEASEMPSVYNKTAPILPMDEHPLRGTYDHANLTYTVTEPIDFTKSDVYYLRMGADEEPYFLKGVDATTGRKTMNNGNYGVIYRLRYQVQGGQPYALRINPSGGYFAGYAVYKQTDTRQLVPIPDGEDEAFGKTGREMYTFATVPGASGMREGLFVWSPPGASNLPIRFYWQAIKKDQDK
jgi:hypothetical protein